MTILLFGYSELVTKALCGFRDVIIGSLLERYLQGYEGWGSRGVRDEKERGQKRGRDPDPQLPFHRAEIERVASDFFRLFVCAGEPKTQTNSTGQLSFHDGSQYAEALCTHGFTNVVLVTDIAAVGSLLHRNTECLFRGERGDPMVDLVVLGVNGIEEDRFRHGTGHLGVSAAVAALSSFYPVPTRHLARLPRLVFVATGGKIARKDASSICGAEAPAQSTSKVVGDANASKRWSWLEPDPVKREGYWIQMGFRNEAVRKQVFLVRDKKMQRFFYDHKVRLYNPREEEVAGALVDDLILDTGFFYGAARDENRESTSAQGAPASSPEASRTGAVFKCSNWGFPTASEQGSLAKFIEWAADQKKETGDEIEGGTGADGWKPKASE